MRLPVVAVFAVSLAALPAAGSMLEAATGGAVAYQFDAGNHHDAPDTCLAASTVWSTTPGTATEAMLVAVDDVADHIVLDVPTSKVGALLEVRLSERIASPDIDLMVWAPGCDGTVFDDQNRPAMEPSPPAPGPGEQQQDVDNLNSAWDCDGDAWSFLVNQLHGGAAPATIHVAWTDGTELDLSLTHSSAGTAHYNATTPLAVLPKGAWVNLPANWSGNFLIGAGPCDATDGGAIYGPQPFMGDDFIAFTPIRPGLHVLQMTLADPDPQLPTSIPVSCHFCVPGLQGAASLASFQVRGDWR